MEKLNEGHIVSCMANCETEKELRDCKVDMMKVDAAIVEYFHRRKIYNRIKAARSEEIRQAMLAPFEDEAKRMQRGQKVYFGKCWIWITSGPLKKIEVGEGCYVWQYQPKSKCLWLCRPGTKCERRNMITQSFTLDNMKYYEISRAELKFRK